MVEPEYNASQGEYYPVLSYIGEYEEMLVLTNKQRITKDGTNIEEVYENNSVLYYGRLEDNSYYAWETEANIITVRIPWMLISFSDPSDMMVLYDEDIIISPVQDEIDIVKTEGIMVCGILVDTKTGEAIGKIGSKEQEAFAWESWDVPGYTQRMKESYYIIRDYFE